MTIKDIAIAAGVSPSTVSKVINQKDDNINAETRRRVLRVIEENNYIPYAGVRGRLLARNNQIALVIPSFNDAFYIDFAERVQRLARSKNYAITVQSSSGNTEIECKILSELNDAYIAGILLFPSSIDSVRYLTEEAQNLNSAVMMDSSISDSPFPQLSRDFASSAEFGTTYLLKNSHRRIALALERESSADIQKDIITGYKTSLSAANAMYDDQLVVIADDSFELQLSNLSDAGIDAVVCQNGRIASEALRILLRRNNGVPVDISILSLEDSKLMEQLVPTISSIGIDTEKMANMALDALISQITTGQRIGFTTKLPFSFVERGSVKRKQEPDKKIVIVGSINMDITLNVANFPHSGETILASAQNSWPGGKGANQAIGVSRFGGNAFMIGRLGNDSFGKKLFEQLALENVDMQGVSFSKEFLSGTAYINVQSDGQNTIVVNPGANNTVTPEYIEKNRFIFSNAQYCLIQMEIPFPTVKTVIKICNEQGTKVILKPSPVQKLPDEVLNGLYLLVPNQEEMEKLAPQCSTTKEQAQAMIAKGVKNVIVTLAENGCIHMTENECHEYQAVPF
nr:substrate-binding domain-containing protein [Clostridia bacterium]